MCEDLVSVVVVTYNSSSFVRETLESIYNQDYHSLEVIVSDDASTDNTIDIVTNWLEQHSDRFVNWDVVKTPVNTGIPANCNRGIRATKGKWIKMIAGDDLLVSNCVSKCVSYISNNRDCNILFSNIKRFKVVNGEKCFFTLPAIIDNEIFIDNFCNSESKEQFIILLKVGCFLPAPSVFFRAEFIKSHPYIEKYKYEDDYPLWVNITKEGFKIDYIPEYLVEYRNDFSLSFRKTDYYSRPYMKTRSDFFWGECYDYFKSFHLEEAHNNYRKMLLKYELTEAFLHNKRSKFNSIIVRLLDRFVDVFAKYEF